MTNKKRKNVRKIIHGIQPRLYDFSISISLYQILKFQTYANYIRDESITHFLGTQIAFAAFQEKKDFSRNLKSEVPDFSLEQMFFLYNTRVS